MYITCALASTDQRTCRSSSCNINRTQSIFIHQCHSTHRHVRTDLAKLIQSSGVTYKLAHYVSIRPSKQTHCFCPHSCRQTSIWKSGIYKQLPVLLVRPYTYTRENGPTIYRMFEEVVSTAFKGFTSSCR
jgi:hypothetical protein